MAERSRTLPDTSYRPMARALHWITAGFLVAMVPVGRLMAERSAADLWDGLTNALYSAHKLGGFVLIWIVLVRLGYRLWRGAPADEPTLTPWQARVAHLTHWTLYGLLVAVPLTGWIGVSMFPALGIFGLFSLPAIAPVNAGMAKQVFQIHGVLVNALVVLAAVHVAAALYHHLIRRDGVLRRMLPRRA